MKKSERAPIIRAQAANLFAHKGFSAVGIAELCEATGLGKGALYYHIRSKEGLLYDIATRYIQKLIDEGRQISLSESDPLIRIPKLSFSMISIVSLHSAEMTVCFREIHALSTERQKDVLHLHSTYQQIWTDSLALGVQQGSFRDTPKFAVKGIMGMFFYSFMWLKPKDGQSAEEVANTFSDLIIRAIAKDSE